MSVRKKLIKHGNGFALIFDRRLLNLLGIDGNTLLNISSPDGCSLVITPEKEDERNVNKKRELAQINKKYGKVLKRLADK